MSIRDSYYMALAVALIDRGDEKAEQVIAALLESKNTAFIVGNGGSAAIASHVAEDFTKIAHVPMKTFNDTALVTCLANDFGWEHWIREAVVLYGENSNVGIFISSSGKSPNIINGCEQANREGIFTVTLTGFGVGNPLSELGDVNFIIPSPIYNVVEVAHEAWLLSICDEIAHRTGNVTGYTNAKL